MNKPSANNYKWAIGAMIMGLALHFYYVREMVASMALFSLLFFMFSLLILSGFFLWQAGKQVVIWAHSDSAPPKGFRAAARMIRRDWI